MSQRVPRKDAPGAPQLDPVRRAIEAQERRIEAGRERDEALLAALEEGTNANQIARAFRMHFGEDKEKKEGVLTSNGIRKVKDRLSRKR